MGLAECIILLDNSEKVFFPGQVVSGKLRIIITNKPKIIVKEGKQYISKRKIKIGTLLLALSHIIGIVLECCGKAEVDLSHRGTSQPTKRILHKYFLS